MQAIILKDNFIPNVGEIKEMLDKRKTEQDGNQNNVFFNLKPRLWKLHASMGVCMCVFRYVCVCVCI